MTQRQIKLVENYIRLKVKNAIFERKSLIEEGSKTLSDVFNFISKSKFTDRVMKLHGLVNKLKSINDLERSGVDPDRLSTFFFDLNRKMESIDYLVQEFNNEIES